VQLAALMESFAHGRGRRQRAGRRTTPASPRALPPATGPAGGRPRTSCWLIDVVLGQLRHAKTPARSHSCSTQAERRSPIAVLSGPARFSVHVDRDRGLTGSAGAVPAPATGSGRTPTVPYNTYRARSRNRPRHDRATRPADRTLSSPTVAAVVGGPSAVAGRQACCTGCRAGDGNFAPQSAALSGTVLLASLTAQPPQRPPTAEPG